MRGLICALVALTVIVYAPALRNGFIWDDDDHLTQNSAVASPDGLRQIWSSLTTSRYYPLTLSVFWLERQAWGLNPMPYHAVNILLHTTSVVLLFLLLRRLKIPGAWIAAALWAVHPVNVESVAWITEMKNTLSGVFFLLTLLSYLRYDEEKRKGWYALALVAFAAALLSKPSTVPLPAVLLLYSWWRHGRWWRLDVLPFIALAIGMAALTVAEQSLTVRLEASGEWHLPLVQRFLVAGKAFWFYLGKLVWPARLSFVYPRWETGSGWLLLLAAVAVGIVAFKKRWLGLGYFVVMLAPVLGFVNVYYFRYSFVADHFCYLASIGPLALAAVRLPRSLAGVVLVGFGLLSWQRVAVFRDDTTLWRDTLAKNPDSTLAHNNLGNIERRAGRFVEAEQHYREALRLSPDYTQVHNNLGTVLADLGQRAEAEQEFETALRLRPHYADAHENLVRLLSEQGRDGEAIEHQRAALDLRPSALGYLRLGELLQRQARYAEAAQTYREGLQTFPGNALLAKELARCAQH
jgi:tetratricopeptide (TPR) repeat protein